MAVQSRRILKQATTSGCSCSCFQLPVKSLEYRVMLWFPGNFVCNIILKFQEATLRRALLPIRVYIGMCLAHSLAHSLRDRHSADLAMNSVRFNLQSCQPHPERTIVAFFYLWSRVCPRPCLMDRLLFLLFLRGWDTFIKAMNEQLPFSIILAASNVPFNWPPRNWHGITTLENRNRSQRKIPR